MLKLYLAIVVSIFAFPAYSMTADEVKAQRLVHAIMSSGVTSDYAKGLSYTRFEHRDRCHIYIEANHNGAFQGGYLVDICKNKAIGTN